MRTIKMHLCRYVHCVYSHSTTNTKTDPCEQLKFENLIQRNATKIKSVKYHTQDFEDHGRNMFEEHVRSKNNYNSHLLL